MRLQKKFKKIIAHNIRLVYIPENNRYTVTIFFNDNTIINLMKAEIIL